MSHDRPVKPILVRDQSLSKSIFRLLVDLVAIYTLHHRIANLGPIFFIVAHQ